MTEMSSPSEHAGDSKTQCYETDIDFIDIDPGPFDRVCAKQHGPLL